MKKRILGVILTVAMVISLLAVIPLTVSADGDTFDASADTVIITTDADMAAFAAAVTGGTTFAGKTVKLAADVALNTTVGATSSKPFSGNFDGQGHTVTITQTLENPDGLGGMISFVRVPEDGTVTIQNVHVTGTITASSTSSNKGYFAPLVSCFDAGLSGTGGTLNFTNCRSSVRIDLSGSQWKAVGGLVAFPRHQDGLKPLTINIDSCLWDGIINSGPALTASGGLLGFTGENRVGRTLTVNITNTVAAGTIMLNTHYSDDVGMIVGYAKGSNSSDETAKVTLNVTDVLSTGVMTFNPDVEFDNTKSIGIFGDVNGTTELNATNFYYNAFIRGETFNSACPLTGNTTAEHVTSTNVAAKTAAEFAALTSADFTNATKWTFKAADATNAYIPCPASLAPAEGWIDLLKTDAPAPVNSSEEEENTTEATDNTTAAPTTTEAPATTDALATTEPVTTEKPKKKGCGSSIGAAAAIVLVTAIFGGAAIFRKKED